MRVKSSPNWQFGLGVSILFAALAVGSGGLPLFADTEDDQDPAEPGILVLNNGGRVVSGRILRNGRDYVVKLPSGDMVVPSSMVRLRGSNLQDAYRQLRLGFPEGHGAESHMLLARWCLTQRLFAEARQEIKDALLLEPDRAEAQDMLQRLDSMIDPATRERRPEGPAIVETSREKRRLDDVEALGGLPHEMAVKFTGRIQPLLSNHCALAGCHGQREESRQFRLQKSSMGEHTNRHTSERNLASVLKFVDLDNPRESPLLVKPKGNHGVRGKSIFIGTRGARQYAELKDWVLNVAASREEAGSRSSRTVTSRRGSGKIRTASFLKPDTGKPLAEVVPSSVDPFAAVAQSGVSGRKGNVERSESTRDSDQASDEVPNEDREAEGAALPTGDPFDPAEFNRQHRK